MSNNQMFRIDVFFRFIPSFVRSVASTSSVCFGFYFLSTYTFSTLGISRYDILRFFSYSLPLFPSSPLFLSQNELIKILWMSPADSTDFVHHPRGSVYTVNLKIITIIESKIKMCQFYRMRCGMRTNDRGKTWNHIIIMYSNGWIWIIFIE